MQLYNVSQTTQHGRLKEFYIDSGYRNKTLFRSCLDTVLKKII